MPASARSWSETTKPTFPIKRPLRREEWVSRQEVDPRLIALADYQRLSANWHRIGTGCSARRSVPGSLLDERHLVFGPASRGAKELRVRIEGSYHDETGAK